MNRKDERSKNKNGLISDAPIATSLCHQEEAAKRSIVQSPVDKPIIGSDGKNKRPENGGRVTSTNTRNNTNRNAERFYIPSGYLRSCDYCGNEYTAKRDTSKFCSGRCRQQAWLKNHPEIASAKNAEYRKQLKARIEARGGRWVERQ